MGKKRTLPREILTDDEMDRLLAQCGPTPGGMRNRALVLLMDGTGCRVSEVVALEPKDIDWAEEQANVRHGKGDKQRVVAASPEALVATRAWLDARGGFFDIPDDAPICCEMDGTALKPDKVRKILHWLAAEAGIRKRVHPHGLRHGHTVKLVRAGVPITSVSTQLGHSSIATTHTYCQRLGVGAAIEDVQRALDAD